MTDQTGFTSGSVQGVSFGNGLSGFAATMSDGNPGGLFEGNHWPTFEVQGSIYGGAIQATLDTSNWGYSIAFGAGVEAGKGMGGALFAGGGVKNGKLFATVEGAVVVKLKLDPAPKVPTDIIPIGLR